MTRVVKIYSKTPFSYWLRRFGPSSDETGDAIDIEDIDYVLYSYMTGDLMTIETKEENSPVRSAQQDTQNILRQMLTLISGATINTNRGIRPIKYHGHHLIQFQNTTPDDGWVKLDGNVTSKDALVKFLNFGKVLKRRVAHET